MSVYHYTTQQRLPIIKAAGYLRPSVAYPTPGEKMALWFTISNEWDNTANKGMPALHEGKIVSVTLNPRMTHHLTGGLVRVECADSVAPYDWDWYKLHSGVHRKMARHLYQTAILQGVKPRDWRVTFERVPCEAWTAVHFWDGDQWTLDRPTVELPDPKEIDQVIQDQIRLGRFTVPAQ